MKRLLILSIIFSSAILFSACTGKGVGKDERIPIIFDTDANNELDDQHALAYLLLNDSIFNTLGITVNATWAGKEIDLHVEEAARVVQLLNYQSKVPILKGADADFEDIASHMGESEYDGQEAVNFIIYEAMKEREQKLVLLPVGKLTNIALALKKEPAIADRVRIVWLGSNYPEKGEYNMENDIPSMNYILEQDVPFEIVNVLYGKNYGSAAVTVSQEEINRRMPGLGPQAELPIIGRHGGQYENFGDYSVNLFEHIYYSDENRMRSLFDLVGVAVIKNPDWGQYRELPCPVYRDTIWVDQPDNSRVIGLWEHFDRDRIIEDMFATLEKAQ